MASEIGGESISRSFKEPPTKNDDGDREECRGNEVFRTGQLPTVNRHSKELYQVIHRVEIDDDLVLIRDDRLWIKKWRKVHPGDEQHLIRVHGIAEKNRAG